MNKFFNIYTKTSIIILNTFIALFVINIISFFVLKSLEKKRFEDGGNEITIKYGQRDFDKVYPNYTIQDINALLNESWERPFLYEPFVQFTERPIRGRYVNVSTAGFRYSKAQGPWPPEPANCNVFIFGGSTCFGYGVPDNETIASHLQVFLQKNLGQKIKVYNFGRGHYFSTQEIFLYQKLLLNNNIPNLSIFIDGLNDFAYTTDSPVFTDKFAAAANTASPPAAMIPKLPLVKLFNHIIKGYNKPGNGWDPAELHKYEQEAIYNDPEQIDGVINRYIRNKKFIEKLSEANKTKSVFVWQPVPMYHYPLEHHLFFNPSIIRHYARYGYPQMAATLDKKNLGNNFLWCADMHTTLKEPLYVDSCHYSAKMSKLFAHRIGTLILKRGLLPCADK